jgi:hypothetical protein
MLRPTAALLLTAAATFVHADDPLMPPVAGPTLGINPVAEPVAPVASQPAMPLTYPHEVAAQATYSQPNYQPAAPVYSSDSYSTAPAPMMSAPVPAAYPMAAPAAGCGCQGGGVGMYSAGPIGLPAAGYGYGYGYGGGHESMGFYVGGLGGYTGAQADGMHVRHPYYSYRRPWYANGPMSQNITIAW